MNFKFLVTQVGNAVITTAGHMNEDRVFFSMQLARRLPKSASQTVGRLLGKVPGAATGAASAWLLGQESRAKAIITAAQEQRPSRLLGEIALNLGMLNTADRIADSLDSAASLRSRILWTEGNIDEAINVLPDGKRKRRLSAERKSMSPGWWPDTDSFHVARPAACTSAGAAASLHVLTNSLPHTRSGYAYRSHLVLSTLNGAGHRVAAATRPSYPVTVGRLGTNRIEKVDGIEYLRDVPLRPATTPIARLEEHAAWIANQATTLQVNLLHTTTHYVNGLVTGSAARAVGLPWVYEVRGVLEETWAAAAATPEERNARRTSQRFALMRSKETEVALAADAIITLGTTMRDHLVAGGISADKITLIPNSVSETVVNAPTYRNPSDVRGSLNLPQNGIWVGTAASIVGYEGLDDLVTAVLLARRQGTDLRLLIAGDGVALPDLRERATALGEHAIFTGRVSQAQAVEFQLALDAIVIPRKNEPVCRLVTPIKPIEAMGLGRPVIVSDLPALRELVPDGAGLHTPPESPEELAKVLVAIAEDANLRKKLSENGRAHILQEHRWKDIGQRYVQVYSRLAGGDLQ